eukprot:scaffold68528_cov18-Tisochrysis_lutea.AAC.1
MPQSTSSIMGTESGGKVFSSRGSMARRRVVCTWILAATLGATSPIEAPTVEAGIPTRCLEESRCIHGGARAALKLALGLRGKKAFSFSPFYLKLMQAQ